MRQHNPPAATEWLPSLGETKEDEARFHAFADAIPQMVWTARPDGWLDYVNQRWIAYTGFTAPDLQPGKAWPDAVHPEDLPAILECRTRAIGRGEAYEIESRYRRHDGVYRWHLTRSIPCKDAHGKIVKWYGTTTDIEEQKQALAAAESANRAKSDFLSSMSHELRSPLNAILGFAQLMASESPPPSPAQQASIDQILQAGWHLLELINDVLDLAKIESGKVSLSMEPVSLAEVLLECRPMIEALAQRRDVQLRFPPADIPGFVLADRIRLKQVILNLLSNAIKYNRAHGMVEVTCESGAGRVRIGIRDTGAGLSPEQQAQLFQPFNRLGQEAGPEEGSGIGLVVVKRLVEWMGGALGVDSAVGLGSVFWIELNTASALTVALGDDPPKATAPAPAAEAPGLVQRNLLYVEDNPANLRLIERLIARRADLRLRTAMTGREGVELARAILPEVILMDIHLPDINGIQALEILRADPVTAEIPVIALSANAMPSDIKSGLKAGFFRYLTKPVKLDAFMAALDLALARAPKGPAPGG